VKSVAILLGPGGVAALALLLAATPRPVGGNSEGPPPAHTGGFGEPTCRACHFDAPEEPEAGALLVDGVPAVYRPGAEYAITVTLRDPRLESAGFQLAARFAGEGSGASASGGAEGGHQAGRLLSSGPRVEVVEHGDPAVLYAHQTLAGAAPEGDRETTWTVRWVAPAEPAGPVLFHAAANAANDDDSELGDAVHAATARSEPPGRKPSRTRWAIIEVGGYGSRGGPGAARAPAFHQ
jgi:hypothetical protein